MSPTIRIACIACGATVILLATASDAAAATEETLCDPYELSGMASSSPVTTTIAVPEPSMIAFVGAAGLLAARRPRRLV